MFGPVDLGSRREGAVRLAIVAGALLGLIGIQPAYGNAATAESAPTVAAGLPSLETSRPSRILYLGEPEEDIGQPGSGLLSVGRAGDLAGRPVALIVRAGLGSKAGLAKGLAGRQDLMLPSSSRRVTSGYGVRWDPLGAGWRTHSGIDLAAAYGSPVVASANGTVEVAGWQGGYGLLVELDHGGGVETRYGHLSKLAVQPGQQVKRGDLVGFVGSTGRSTGAHLHYEVRENGRAVDPAAATRR